MSGEGEVALGIAGAVVAAPAAIAVAGAALGAATAVGVAAAGVGAAAAGVAGAAASMVGAATGALQAMKDCGRAAIMAKDAVRDAIGDCADELRDLSMAQANKAKKAYDQLREQLENMDEQRKQDAQKRLLASISTQTLGVAKEDLQKASLGDLADLSSVCFHLDKIDSLLYQMEQEGMDTEKEHQRVEKLRDELHENLKKKKGLGDIDPKAMEIISDIGKRLEQEAKDAQALEPCKKEVLMLQTHIEDPYLGVFESDLLEIMQSQEKPDEAELELERLRTKVIGFSIQARSIEIASSEAYEEMHEYIRAVREKLQEDVHVSEKIRYMDELLPLIESRYKDCLADNRELLEKKAEYDTIHLALASLMAELGQGVPEYKFSASDPSASIASETLLVEQKGELLDRRHAQEKIHKAIGDAMRKRRWGLVAQERFEDEG
ncbi:MAG: hypothetical protein K6E59_03495, partial [Bacilli bacterium]|nr:hypothetical protein [Bacilli bacterium]